jgi:hypothetical protein
MERFLKVIALIRLHLKRRFLFFNSFFEATDNILGVTIINLIDFF